MIKIRRSRSMQKSDDAPLIQLASKKGHPTIRHGREGWEKIVQWKGRDILISKNYRLQELTINDLKDSGWINAMIIKASFFKEVAS